LLLTIAAVNVAGVQLVRVVGQGHELAIRSAIGASPLRIGRQVLVENAVLSGLGGAVGTALAVWLHRLLPVIVQLGLPWIENVSMDWRVLAFAFALTMILGFSCSALPAFLVSRLNIVDALKEDNAAASSGASVSRIRWFMLAGQVVVAAALLT